MKQFIIVLLLVSAFTFSCKEEVTEGSIKIVTAEEMKELSHIDDVQLLDVRTPEEYAIGYIDGFQNIDFLSDSFQKAIEKLDKSKPVIVYCKSGGRSGRCSALMLEKGFKKIYDLEGGITKWESEGNPIKKDSE